MNFGIIYLVCFIAVLILLLIAIEVGGDYSTSQILLMVAMTVGNGGYYALAKASNLEEGILACKLTYLVGIFVPILLFFTICEICAVTLDRRLKTVLMLIQVIIYGSVCTIGTLPIYYKTVEFHQQDGIGYITKTYGPFHTAYIVSMVFYMVAAIVVAVRATQRKSKVSSDNVSTLIILEFVTIVAYFVERMTKTTFEVVPVANTITLFFLFKAVTRIQTYSLIGNTRLIDRKINSSGFIVFDTKLRYMGCNDMAAEIFPELLTWMQDKKIPGSGGRFNTYLRQPMMAYVESGNTEEGKGNPFSIKGQKYISSFDTIRNKSNRVKGYIIEINDVTTILEEQIGD